MDKKQIIDRLTGTIPSYPPATHYIRRSERKRQGVKYVLTIPLWRDGCRKSRYIGTFKTLEEAQQAREFTFKMAEELQDVSLKSPRTTSLTKET